MIVSVTYAFTDYWNRLDRMGLESVRELNESLGTALRMATGTDIAIIADLAGTSAHVVYTEYSWIKTHNGPANQHGEMLRIYWSYIGSIPEKMPKHRYNEAQFIKNVCHWSNPTSSGAPTLNPLFPDALGHLIREHHQLPPVNLADALRRGREAFEQG